MSRVAIAQAIERKYGAEFRANQVPIVDEDGRFTGEYYDRRLGGPPDQPDPGRVRAAHLEYFRSTGRQGLPADFDPVEDFESEGLFDSFGNILALGGEQSLTGLALESAGFDPFDREKLAHFQPNLAEQIASGILSFGMPLDLAALVVGGGVGGAFAKSVGVARAAGRFGAKALPGVKARVATRALTGAGGFGTYEGARGIFEGEPFKRAFKGAIFGGAMGLAGGIVPRSIKIPKVVTSEAGAVRVGRVAEVSAEVFTLGALPGPLEGRAPTADDFIHAAGFILGLKTVGKIASLGKRRWDKQVLPLKEEIQNRVKADKRNVGKAEKLRTAVFAMSDRVMRETPEQFSAKFYEKIKAAKQGEKVGVLGDLFMGREIRKSFKGELDTPIYIGDAETISKRVLGKGEVATGWLSPDPAGKQSIWLNREFPDTFSPTLIHEALHLKRMKVKRPIVTVKGREVPVAEAAAERGAEFILRTRGRIPLREAVGERVGRPQWVKDVEKRGILLQKRLIKGKEAAVRREVYHIRNVTGRTSSEQIGKVRDLIKIVNQEGVPLYLTKALAKTQLGADLAAAGLTKKFRGGVKIIGTGRILPPTKAKPITEAEAVVGIAELDRELKAITAKPTIPEARLLTIKERKWRVAALAPKIKVQKEILERARRAFFDYRANNKEHLRKTDLEPRKDAPQEVKDSFATLSKKFRIARDYLADLQQGKIDPAETKKVPPLRTIFESEARALESATSDSKIIRVIKAGWEALPSPKFLVRSRFLSNIPQYKKMVDLAYKANQKRAELNTFYLKELNVLSKEQGRFDKTIKGEAGKQWTEDLMAGKFPMVEAIFKKIFDSYNAVAAVPMGFWKRYFPREITESIRGKLELGLHEINKMVAHIENPSDEILRQAMKRLELRKRGFEFTKKEAEAVTPEQLRDLSPNLRSELGGIIPHKTVVVSAIEIVRRQRGITSISKAIERLGVEYIGTVFEEPRYSKKRTLELPSSWYETDAGKVIPKYIDVMTKSIAEKTFFGGRAEKYLELLQEIEGVDFTARKAAEEMMARWTGHYQREHALKGGWKTLVDWFVMLQVATKIGLGQATALNFTQLFISTMPRTGVWNTIAAGALLFNPARRARITATGIADNFVAQALQAAIGNMPGGWFGKFAQFTTKWSGFSTINKFNLYLAASAFERAATQWHRQAQGTGRLTKLRQKQLETFGIDWRKKMTKEQMDEAMFNFAKDSQLQAGVLSEPLIAADPRIRPLILFKRFGFKQVLLIKDIIMKDVFWGDIKKNEINPMPIIRLAAGGAFGGAGIGWALNQIKEALGGQPIIDRSDSTFQRFVENIATVGAFGMVGDALAIEKMSNLPRTLKFIGYPVVLADAETLLKNFGLFWADYERYDDFWLAGRRNVYKVFDLAGTFPRHLAKRLRTEGQVSRSMATQKGQQKTAFFRLMLDGNREAAQSRLLRWDKAHPDNKFRWDEVSMSALRSWLERRAVSIAEGQAVKGTPEFRKIKREEQQKLRKRLKENR